MQAAEDVQRLMRSQGFALHEPNPRMLPRTYTPTMLPVVIAAAAPSPEAADNGARRGGGGRGRRGGKAGAKAGGGRGRKGGGEPAGDPLAS